MTIKNSIKHSESQINRIDYCTGWNSGSLLTVSGKLISHLPFPIALSEHWIAFIMIRKELTH